MDSVGPTGGVDQSLTAARLWRLRDFREEVLCCLGRRRDALFELVDALLAAELMPSLPHLSLLPLHRRSWGSGYAALAVGEVDGERVAAALTAQCRGHPPPVFAVDASTWARCDAECSPGRGLYYSPARHSASPPLVAGWCYSWIAQLSFERDSWTAPLDARRVSPGQDVGQVTAAQIRALTARLDADGTVPLVVCDAGYDPIALTVDLADVAVAVIGCAGGHLVRAYDRRQLGQAAARARLRVGLDVPAAAARMAERRGVGGAAWPGARRAGPGRAAGLVADAN